MSYEITIRTESTIRKQIVPDEESAKKAIRLLNAIGKSKIKEISYQELEETETEKKMRKITGIYNQLKFDIKDLDGNDLVSTKQAIHIIANIEDNARRLKALMTEE